MELVCDHPGFAVERTSRTIDVCFCTGARPHRMRNRTTSEALVRLTAYSTSYDLELRTFVVTQSQILALPGLCMLD